LKPAPFDYVAAQSVEHVLEVKARHGAEASFLAGGQSLIPAMNFRLAQPALLVDLKPLRALDYVRRGSDGALRIGALTVHRTLERDALIARFQPLLHETVPCVAHPQIRTRGTLGGNLAHADPASEYPAVMVALGARLRARSVRGERWIEARDFFVGVFTTSLQDDEMLVEVELPGLPPRTGTCFVEVARRQGDYAMMGAAAVIALDENGLCAQARLAFCSAGETPVSARATSGLTGRRLSAEDLRATASAAAGEIRPSGNVHASGEFRRHLAAVMGRRALDAALARAVRDGKGER
jgi:carbon-monoxide dehydrogenase medium subunit